MLELLLPSLPVPSVLRLSVPRLSIGILFVALGFVALSIVPRPLAAQPVSTHGTVTQQSGRQIVIELDDAYAVTDTATGRIFREGPRAESLARFAVRSASASVIIARITEGEAAAVRKGQRVAFSTVHPSEQEHSTAALLLKSAPPAAAVRLVPAEGEARALGKTPTTVFLPAGTHRLQFRKAGRAPLERRITVEADAAARRTGAIRTVAVTLAAQPGSLMVRTTPDSATVYVDSAEVGTGHVRTAVPAGSHRVRATAQGYHAQSQTLSVQGGQRQTVVLDLSRQMGFLRVTSVPTGAVLSIGGKRLGRTPIEVQQPLGKQTVRVERDGFMPAEGTVRLAKEKMVLKLALRRPLQVKRALEQSDPVREVKLEREKDRMLIRYALSDAEKLYDVSLEFSRDGGASYDDVPDERLHGDVGRSVASGAEKEIQWDAIQQYPAGLTGTDYVLRIDAEEYTGGRYPSRPGFFIEAAYTDASSPPRGAAVGLGETQARIGYATRRATFALNANRGHFSGIDVDGESNTLPSADTRSIGPEIGVLLLKQSHNWPIALYSSVTFLYTQAEASGAAADDSSIPSSYTQRQLFGRARAYHVFSLGPFFDVVPQLRATPAAFTSRTADDVTSEQFTEPRFETSDAVSGGLGFFIGSGSFGLYFEAGLPLRTAFSSSLDAVTFQGGLRF